MVRGWSGWVGACGSTVIEANRRGDGIGLRRETRKGDNIRNVNK